MKLLSYKKNCSLLANHRGLALIETLPILIIFVVLFGYGLGMFGFVHTGIMNSMAARTYAFETFRNRTDLTYFRDEKSDDSYLDFSKIGNRIHSISSEKNIDRSLGEDQYATTRPLVLGRREPDSKSKADDHNNKIYEIVGRNRKGGVEVSPGWVMVGYGICLNLRCGD